MSSKARTVAAASKTRLHYHSAIGTHRLSPRPLKNILYPYHRNYKPVYRARNARTPSYYWPEIDKYPWHSHQKRFPAQESLGIEFFSEFVKRDERIRTLYETLHPLPLRGVNCLVWKPVKYKESDSPANRKIIKINDLNYVVDEETRNNTYYLIKSIDYRLRPFKAKIIADLYMKDSLIKSNISPVGSVRGIWRYSFPYKFSDCDLNLNDKDTYKNIAFKVSDLNLYRPNNIRPFKNLCKD
ncbi:hypothetical protein BEWA_018050 [Theileria equi strain WA]|uniref:Uncharacterized protein n=1 Tax=Theileria equi strain WA TaxID=1537102 RepID=L0AVQ6_THEEQ|nr:hypothetical protein BEWA_018050 [Theileria equi strain WA]AFZ78964.1 hypothetical protein BEWA_018050 [Theileria equi strain WA]|eukprot:XP_004828630.1 hypothetical protein BEWA_018050 [Theileria equi strain WA]